MVPAGSQGLSRVAMQTADSRGYAQLRFEGVEVGADAVLVNTAIASANDPVQMARAFKMATEAGRIAYETGLAPKSDTASASSPLTGFLRNQ